MAGEVAGEVGRGAEACAPASADSIEVLRKEERVWKMSRAEMTRGRPSPSPTSSTTIVMRGPRCGSRSSIVSVSNSRFALG